MLRAQTLQSNSSLQHDNVIPEQPVVSKQYRNVNKSPHIKYFSVEAVMSSYLDFNINSTKIISNPLIANNASNKKNNSYSNKNK